MRRTALVAGLLMLGIGCTEAVGPATVRRVIEELAAGDYGAATSRFRNHEQQVLSPAAAPVWRRGLGHQDPTVREWAIDALSRIGQHEDVPRLEQMLTDSSRGVRRAAMEGLIRLDPAAARQAFERLLHATSSAQVVLGAQGLAQLGEPSSVPEIVGQFENHALPDATRAALAQALATLADPAAGEALLAAAVDSHESRRVRRMAADALVALKGDTRPLLERMRTADDSYVRELAQQALASRD